MVRPCTLPWYAFFVTILLLSSNTNNRQDSFSAFNILCIMLGIGTFPPALPFSFLRGVSSEALLGEAGQHVSPNITYVCASELPCRNVSRLFWTRYFLILILAFARFMHGE